LGHEKPQVSDFAHFSAICCTSARPLTIRLICVH
jgi:hypothetical protein